MRPPSIKLPMADLSHIQTAQDEAVKPSTSSTLDIGKFPAIPPHKGSWYNVVGEKYLQNPQVVPQAFSNIAKPGYRSGPPATVKMSVSPIFSPPSVWPVSHLLTTSECQETNRKNCLTNLEPLRMDQLGSKSCYNFTKLRSKKPPKCNSCLT